MRRTTWARGFRFGLLTPLILILFSVQPARIWCQGTLWQMREDVRAAPASGSSGGNRDDDRDDDDRRKRRGHDPFCEDEDSWSEVKGMLFMAACYGAAWVATSPFWVPAMLVGDHYDAQGTFALHPYRDDLDGFMVFEEVADQESYLWSLRGRAEYADDFDDQLRFGGNLLLESAIRFGIDTSFDYRRESITSGIHDSLWTGDANIVFRFAQSQKLVMRSGLGVNWLSDQYGSDFGFNFTYGGDWFPREPWVVSAEIDWGRLGRSELFHGRGTIGLNFRHWEVFTGYDFYHVGRAEVSGLVSGVRFWY